MWRRETSYPNASEGERGGEGRIPSADAAEVEEDILAQTLRKLWEEEGDILVQMLRKVLEEEGDILALTLRKRG
jgi:hypothetical protein